MSTIIVYCLHLLSLEVAVAGAGSPQHVLQKCKSPLQLDRSNLLLSNPVLENKWNSKLAHGVSMETHTNVVEGFLCSDHSSLKNQLLSRYPKLVRKLLGSSSKEIRFLSKILWTDQRSNLCRNISYLSDLTKLENVIMVASSRVKQALRVKCTLEPWRKALLQIRYDKSYSKFDMTKDQCDKFIDSLCTSWGTHPSHSFSYTNIWTVK